MMHAWRQFNNCMSPFSVAFRACLAVRIEISRDRLTGRYTDPLPVLVRSDHIGKNSARSTAALPPFFTTLTLGSADTRAAQKDIVETAADAGNFKTLTAALGARMEIRPSEAFAFSGNTSIYRTLLSIPDDAMRSRTS